MPTFVKVLVMAVLQGLTEFLPVSSSGHLVLFKHWLRLDSPGAFLEVGLHAGTMVSVLVYYRQRIMDLIVGVFTGSRAARGEVLALVVGSVPVAAVFFLLKDHIEALFDRPMTAAGLLMINGAFIVSLHMVRHRDHALSVPRGLWIGVAQALAVLPGISRAGMTVGMGRHLGLSPTKAAEFSLLLSLPALAGATLVKGMGLQSTDWGDVTVLALVTGMVLAAVVGYGAIVLLVKALRTNRFWLFGFYCMAIGAVGLMTLRGS